MIVSQRHALNRETRTIVHFKARKEIRAHPAVFSDPSRGRPGRHDVYSKSSDLSGIWRPESSVASDHCCFEVQPARIRGFPMKKRWLRIALIVVAVLFVIILLLPFLI